MVQRAVVTGCSSGIGRATAISLYEAGFDTLATMRRPEDGEDLPCRVERLDVDSDESVADLFGSMGPVDLLVNNAGVPAPGSVEDTGLDTVRATLETNFFGVVRCTRAVLPGMRHRRSGAIVTVSSIAGRLPLPMEAAYNASKFAVEGWVETLAYEVASFGIRVALVEPGVVLTPIFEKGDAEPSPPYEEWATRLFEVQMGCARFETAAEDVAEVVLEAATTEEPHLRWPVGPDADRLEYLLAESTPEQRRDVFTHADAECFWPAFRSVFGGELTPPSR